MIEEQLYVNAVGAWRLNKGKGTFIIPSPLDSLKPLLYILPQIYNKSPTTKVVIVTKDFVDRGKVENYFTTLSNTVWSNSFRNLICNGCLKIITDSVIGDDAPYLTVIYAPNSFLSVHSLLMNNSKFNLVILTKKLSSKDMNGFYGIAPSINSFNQATVDEVRSNLPVKEWLHGIAIDADSEFGKQVAYYNKEISTGIAIFGNFDNIKYARLGNSDTNCSSMTICDALARQNGWSPNLDMSSQFNVDIDRLYSPTALKERADSIYNLIRERSTILSSSKEKLDIIKTIVADNVDKNILIINKHGEFANAVTNYLNDNTNVCANYHDKVDNIPAIDDDGNVILVKSGERKGLPKMLGVVSQKKLAQKLMNSNKIHVISSNASPDKSLDVDIDVVIITSPLCDTIESYFYRLSKVRFAKTVVLHTLYYKSTIEERRLADRTTPINHTVINKDDVNVKVDDNYDYCLVD
jgi:hypothetical protein